MFDAPIDLFHDLQGGTIASQRPPPPGVGQPYPGLGDVPARPTPTTAGGRKAIYAALAAERDRVKRQGERDPLPVRPQDVPPPPAPATSAPTPAGAPAASAPAEDSAPSVAVLPAADAPPAKAVRPTAPPIAPPGPLPELEARAAAGGTLPAIPAAPPAAPALEGLPAPPGPPGTVNVYFRRGSAVVPLDADAALRQLAAERRSRSIVVRAPGDPAGRGPDGAAAGLALGLRRAQAIATVLAEAGVPAGSLDVLAGGGGPSVIGQAGVARVVDRN